MDYIYANLTYIIIILIVGIVIGFTIYYNIQRLMSKSEVPGPFGYFISKDGSIKHIDTIILIIVASILIFVSIISLFNFEQYYKQYQIASFVGIAAFIIPIILALSRRFNLASRFGNGEVRKAIVIALTVIYIIMLSSYFYEVTLPLGKNLSKPLSNSSPMPAIMLPVSSQLQNNSPGSPTIPVEALKDISTNFFWIYAVIIVFYFGSRAWESVAEVNMVKELKDLGPLELAQRRYVLGMMSPENYEEMNEKLEGEVVLMDVVPAEDKKLIEVRKFNLIIKNLGNEDRKVTDCWINDESVKDVPLPAKVGAKSYLPITVSITDTMKTGKTKYEFEIAFDKGDKKSFTVQLPQN